MAAVADTALEAERRLYEVYRRMPPVRKLQLVEGAYRVARQLHAAGCRLRHAGASDADVNRAWTLTTLGSGPWLERMRFESIKIDVFIRKHRAFDGEVLARGIGAAVFGESEGQFNVITAEDVILLKLEWYRLGGEVSDRQWNDVRGVLKTQQDRLDRAYLRHWSAEIGVRDLLARAESEA